MNPVQVDAHQPIRFERWRPAAVAAGLPSHVIDASSQRALHSSRPDTWWWV